MTFNLPRFDKEAPADVLPSELAVLMVGIAARQAASPTARNQARLATTTRAEATLFAPRDGAFNGSVADAINKWKE